MLLLNNFLRDGEHCIVLSASSSPLGDAVVFTSGSLYNLTSGTWSSLQEPSLSFNMALVRVLKIRKYSRSIISVSQVDGLPVVIGRARQEGRVLLGDKTVWQLHLESGRWRQVMEIF